jgi:bla regulator protein blaR1
MIETMGVALANHLWQSTLFAGAAGLVTLLLRNNRAQVRYHLWLAASLKFLIPFSLLTAIGGQLGWRAAPAHPRGEFPLVVETITQQLAPFASLASVEGAAAGAASAIPPPAPAAADTTAVFLLALWACGFVTVLAVWANRWIRVYAGIRRASPLRKGPEIGMLRALQLHYGMRSRIELVSCADRLEPGVFGFRRPVVFLPAGISEHLTPAQLKAILAHELFHVRCRHTVVAAAHTLVEAIFWFHPLVWWVGARMVNERERACDEEVLRLGNERLVYAESILTVCRLYLASPAASVAGVASSNLRQRIEEIMADRSRHSLSFAKKLLLAAAGTAAIAAPILIGLVNTPQIRAQQPAQTSPPALPSPPSPGAPPPPQIRTQHPETQQPSATPQPAATPRLVFEVASMRYAPMPPGGVSVTRQGGPGTNDPTRLTYRNVPLKSIFMNAWGLQDFQISGPGWIDTERYDINANIPPDATIEQFNIMMQNLLMDRLQMTVHREKKDFSAYTLVVGKNGLKMKESDANAGAPPPVADGTPLRNQYKGGSDGFPQLPAGRASVVGSMSYGHNRFTFVMVSMPGLAMLLENQIGRPVADETGLTGKYDFKLDFSPDGLMGAMALAGAQRTRPGPNDDPSDTGPIIFQAVQDQLGLKLEEKKVPFDVLVIDHLEKMPTAN